MGYARVTARISRAATIAAGMAVSAFMSEGAAVAQPSGEAQALRVVAPPGALDRIIGGGAARVCAPDVAALPGNLTHFRPPAGELARSLLVDFCEAAVVPAAAADPLISEAASMGLGLESRPFDIAAVMLGANDARDINGPNGFLRFGSEEWRKAYGDHVVMSKVGSD